MIPTTCPASTWKLTPATVVSWPPGGVSDRLSTTRDLAGGGNSVRSPTGGGTCPNNLSSRAQAWRAPTKCFQLAIAASTGASARPDRIELAKMIPAVALPSITSIAPTVSTTDCSTIRATLLIPDKVAVVSVKVACWSRYS